MLALKTLALWLLFLGMAFANGALREIVLLKIMPRSYAYIISGLILIACVLVTAAIFLGWLGRLSLTQYILIGVTWLALTLVFEFSFAMVLRGQSLASALDAYRLRDGNIWPIVLLFVAAAPAIAAYARGFLSSRGSP